MSSAYIPYQDVYSQPAQRASDSRDAERHDRRPQDDTDALVRQRQWEAYVSAPGRRDDGNGDTRRGRRDSSAPDARYDGHNLRYAPRQHNAWQRGSSESDDSYASDSRSRSSSRSRSRRQRRRADDNVARRRTESEMHLKHERPYDGDVRARLSRAFDTSGRGVLAAAAGAGVGAIATRRFGDRDHFEPSDGNDTWKTIGGALVGGALANAAENRWKRYEEEKDRQAEAKGHAQQGR